MCYRKKKGEKHVKISPKYVFEEKKKENNYRKFSIIYNVLAFIRLFSSEVRKHYD